MAQPRRIQTIQLENYDDVVSIRDRLQFADFDRVLLIVPKNSDVLKRKLDLVLIQREAARRKIQLALLTQDPDIVEHAASLNLSTFFTVRQARARRWKTAQNRIFVDRSHRPVNAPLPYELMAHATRLRPAPGLWTKRGIGLWRLGIGLVLIFVTFGAIVAIIPSATVTLTPATDAINEQILITADSEIDSIDVLNTVVPAEVVRLLAQGTEVMVPTTGRREATDTLARGQVTFTNQTDQPLFIPAGTIVSTETTPPARFQTDDVVALPAQIDAALAIGITALPDSAGLLGNVQPGTITRVEGNLETLIAVTNPNATFGGDLGEEAVVTQEDQDRLLTLGRQAVQQAARSELSLQLPAQDKFLIPGSIEIVEERPEWFVYSAGVGEAADSVSLTMRGAIEATVVDQQEARNLAFIILSRRLPDDREIEPSLLNFRQELVGLDDQGRYQFQMFVTGDLPFAIDPESVAERINGLTVSEANRVLENEYLLNPQRPPQIQTAPFGVGRLPILAVRIDIVIRRE